ncbi:MAG TPA: glutathione S-transferase family protein, partial [Pseudomonadales bacterium]|nr:glutathione S-transferase family protein [Pseudomonadales bacterium]
MALRLYDHPLSPYGQKVKIALIEKGIEFQGMLPNAIGSGQVDSEFAAANPRGEVPALLDGDTAIFDSTVILEYIEDKWPEPALLPVSPLDRARVRMLEDVMDTHFEAITWALSEIRNFGRAEGAEATRLE